MKVSFKNVKKEYEYLKEYFKDKCGFLSLNDISKHISELNKSWGGKKEYSIRGFSQTYGICDIEVSDFIADSYCVVSIFDDKLSSYVGGYSDERDKNGISLYHEFDIEKEGINFFLLDGVVVRGCD